MLKIVSKDLTLINILYLHWNVHEVLGVGGRHIVEEPLLSSYIMTCGSGGAAEID